MLKVNLHLVTVSVSVRKPELKSNTNKIAERYEDQMRIDQLVEETKRKRDEHFYMYR